MSRKNKKVKKIHKIVICLLIAFVVGVASLFGTNAYVKSSVKDRIIPAADATDFGADCILVLGARVYESGTLSPMLQDRLTQGIELYNGGASDRLLVSGDHGSDGYDEVNAMKQFAIDAGIASENIFMDHAGFSTYESLYRARDIFEVKKIIIVTQNYHLYRALYIAKKLGLDAYGVASDPQKYGGQTKREIREIVARVKDFFFVIVKPKPTYLGETIPVDTNGDLTND